MQPFRPTSSLKNDENNMVRPISAIKAAGFEKTDKPRSVFDDLEPEDTDQSIERQIEALEISIFENVREAMAFVARKEYSQANAKLGEASAFLGQIKKINAEEDQVDLMAANVTKLDCVIRRHVVKVFIAAKQYDPAIAQCEKMLKVTQAAETAEVRVLMGNCFYYKGEYEKAHKEFSMALDIVPADGYARLRQSIAKQIAITQIKMNRWNEAIDVIEENLIKSLALKNAKNETQDNVNIYALMTKFSPIFTLILCYYAINDERQMMEAFKKLIETCKLIGDNPDMFDDEDNQYFGDNVMNNGGDDELDSLSRYNAGIRHELRSKLLQAARLLAPVICHKELDGYEKLAELLREKGHQSLSLQVLMSKALYELDKNNFEEATKTMREIDRVGLESALAMGINVPHQVLESCKDASLTIEAAAEQNKPKEDAAEALGIDKKLIVRNENENYEDMEREREMSAKPVSANATVMDKHNRIPYATFVPRGVHTNIAFIHYLKGDYESAFKHAETATIVDPFDSFAKVNLGCTYARLENYNEAQKQFEEAYEMNPECLQAVYDSGLIFFKQEKFEEALMQFSTVVRRIPRQADAIFMCSECLIQLKRIKEAIDMLNKLMTIYSSVNAQDPCVYSRLGELYAINGEESEGAHYFKEAHRLLPYDLNIIKWLGSYYVREELFEEARQCFERGARVDYLTPQWFLSAAACLRKTNEMREAVEEYRKILRKWPACVDALKYLIVCLQNLGQVDEATLLTQRLEKIQENAAHDITNEVHGTAILDPKVVRVADDKVKMVEDEPALENDDDLFGNDDVANKLLADEADE